MSNSTNFSARKISSETTSNSKAEVKAIKTQKDLTSEEVTVKKKDEGLKLQLPQDKTYLDTINDEKSDSDESENGER